MVNKKKKKRKEKKKKEKKKKTFIQNQMVGLHILCQIYRRPQ